MPEDLPEYAEITSHYLRNRECLLLRAQMEPIFVDYYLHWAELAFQLQAEEDTVLKDLLGVLVLHTSARPRTERHGWTVHLPDWPRNFFASVSGPEEEIICRVFRDDVAQDDEPTLVAQFQEGSEPARTSVIALESGTRDLLASAGEFYQRSEQRPSLFARGEGDDYLLLAAMPGSNLDWVRAQDSESLLKLAANLEGEALERRQLRFACSCSLERIFPAIEALLRGKDEDIFGTDEALTISCPRCARQYRLTREQAEAMLEASDSDSDD